MHELDTPIDIYQAAARRLDSELDPIKLRARMNEMVDLRNRIARRVERRNRLDGLLHEHYRAAA